jgi:hypothetical protein
VHGGDGGDELVEGELDAGLAGRHGVNSTLTISGVKG